MINYKTAEDIDKLREGGKIHARILKEVANKAKSGVKTSELNSYAERLIDEAGCTAAFLGYTPRGIKNPYPASICVSINEEIVHGIPSEKRVLQDGDIVTIDLGLNYQGMITDAAITIPIGNVDDTGMKLIKYTKEALDRGIEAMKIGGHVGDIGSAIIGIAEKSGFSIAEDLSGHGVGFAVHEEPFVPNIATKGDGPELKEGLVIAIEPMLCEGDGAIQTLTDEYTCVTRDGSRAAHFEHTVVVTGKGVEILTKI